MSKRKCIRCGKDPAEGFASIWTAEKGEQFYCHGDDAVSCYERAGYDAVMSQPVVEDEGARNALARGVAVSAHAELEHLDLDLDALYAVADKALGPAGIYPETWWGQAANRWKESPPADMPEADMRFIATFDPRVVRELVTRLIAAERITSVPL